MALTYDHTFLRTGPLNFKNTYVQISASLFINCMILGKWLNIFESHFPHGDYNNSAPNKVLAWIR